MRYLAILLFAAVPAMAYTPEELMGERVVTPPECSNGVCTMSQADLEFITQRGRLMEEIANRLYGKLQSCQGGRNV
jgi:hypothetical protein